MHHTGQISLITVKYGGTPLNDRANTDVRMFLLCVQQG